MAVAAGKLFTWRGASSTAEEKRFPGIDKILQALETFSMKIEFAGSLVCISYPANGYAWCYFQDSYILDG